MVFMLRAFALILLIMTRQPAFAAPVALAAINSTRPSTNQVCPKAFKNNLSGLYKIPTEQYKPIKQPFDQFETLYSKAYYAQVELETLCTTIAMSTETSPLFSGVKSKERAKQKIATELNGNCTHITDLARATLVAKDIPSLVAAFDALSEHTDIILTQNRFRTPAPSGYRDLKVLVALPHSKIIAEVQFHLAQISKIKNGPEHELYQAIQTIERDAVSQGRALNDIELAKIQQMRQQSIALYQTAWQQYLTPNAWMRDKAA